MIGKLKGFRMSITTIIGIVGGLSMIAFEYYTTGNISAQRLTDAFAFAGLGFFAQDGKILIPYIAKFLDLGLDKATGKFVEVEQEPIKVRLVNPTKLPNEDRKDVLRQIVADKTKMKRVQE